MATSIGTLVYLKLAAPQREIVTLTGTSGTANISAAGGLTKLATFTTDLPTTAKNFVTSWASAYLTAGIILTCTGNALCFTSAALGTAIVAPTIANASGTLAGTVSHVNPNNGNLAMIGETTSSLKSAQAMIETSNKQSVNNATFASGRINRTIAVTSISSTDTATTLWGFDLAVMLQLQSLQLTFTMTEYNSGALVSGATVLSGSAEIADATWEGPDNAKLTFSLSLQVSTSVTVGVNP